VGTHTDSAEEVLVVLDGEVEIVVGDERHRASAGAIAVVPARGSGPCASCLLRLFGFGLAP
jgi:uncharacterized cupin superfamily protein